MPNELLQIAFYTACFCSIWVKDLTALDGGLLWFVPKYYPYPETFFGKVLTCAVCLSGWTTLLILATYCTMYGGWLWLLPNVFASMAIAKIITK